jgi:hypothetical protein
LIKPSQGWWRIPGDEKGRRLWHNVLAVVGCGYLSVTVRIQPFVFK